MFRSRNIVLLAVVLGSASVASATLHRGHCGPGQPDGECLTFVDFHKRAPLDFLYEQYPGSSYYDSYYKGTFDIGWTDFDPTKYVLKSLKVGFAFADDSPGKRNHNGSYSETYYSNGRWYGDVEERVDIYLGDPDVKIWNDLEVDGSHRYGYDWHYQYINNQSIIDDLLLDGKLDYKVKLQELLYDNRHKSYKREDTYLKQAKLIAEICRIPHDVPDSGATLGLIGLSLAALAAMRRRLRK